MLPKHFLGVMLSVQCLWYLHVVQDLSILAAQTHLDVKRIQHIFQIIKANTDESTLLSSLFKVHALSSETATLNLTHFKSLQLNFSALQPGINFNEMRMEVFSHIFLI